jgi:integrase
MTLPTGKGRKLARCVTCTTAPVAMSGVDYCFRCWPGGPVTPPPCLRCGSRRGYFATGLCERCHPYADPGVDSCLDCLAWGARRTHGWLCRGCVSWRAEYANPANGSHGPCRACGRVLTLGGRGVCRLCHKHASLTREPNEPLDVIGANKNGQQLYFADMFRPAGIRPTVKPAGELALTPCPPLGHRPSSSPPPTDRPHWLEQTDEQLVMFTMKPNLAAHGRAGLHQLAHPDDVAPLEAVAHQLADANKWSPKQRKEAIIGTRIMLGIQVDGRAPVRASEVEALRDIDMCVWTVIEVLATAGALIEDRVPAIDAWFDERIAGLPDPMVAELRIWFDIMKNGTRTPPRRRPRSQQTINLHLNWALPILRQWAAAGQASLREITKEHVLDALPATGAERSRAGQGLKSIFRLLKGRKVLFLDPTARLKTGEHPSNQPLPLDPDRIRQVRDLLFAEDPATAVVVALIAFHGIRMGQLQRIELTDIRDGRLAVDGRLIPLADPVRERLAAWLDHRATTWPNTTNGYLFVNRRSAYRDCTVGTRWLRLAIGPTVTPRQLREDRILAEAHANGGDVRAISDLFGLSINASSRYAYTLEHDDFIASSRTRDKT